VNVHGASARTKVPTVSRFNVLTRTNPASVCSGRPRQPNRSERGCRCPMGSLDPSPRCTPRTPNRSGSGPRHPQKDPLSLGTAPARSPGNGYQSSASSARALSCCCSNQPGRPRAWDRACQGGCRWRLTGRPGKPNGFLHGHSHGRAKQLHGPGRRIALSCLLCRRLSILPLGVERQAFVPLLNTPSTKRSPARISAEELPSPEGRPTTRPG
jgi:hypothetical protein